VESGPPADGTLQLLPGRFEVLRGASRVEEIRFVRSPGPETVVTFGRSEGEPHRHVHLDPLTVSRVHAAMRFKDGRWHIENRSRTNPVLVNGVPLAVAGGWPVPLADGDLVEMGEVLLRFHAS
jgi:pSer/pThr/pTyr-binding forkhead associated (FHA) protein